ncbi:MAG: capsule assembly Wzi family protein [Gemmatimonadaceae bacterium]
MSGRVPQSKTWYPRTLSLVAALAPSFILAQSPTDSGSTSAPAALSRFISPLTLVGGLAADRMRLDQLQRKASLDGYLIRSASSLTPRPASATWWSAAFIAPEYYAVNNSAIPFSVNNGPVWAGVGTSSRILAGAHLAAGPFRLILAPEFVHADNSYFQLRDTVRFYSPPVPEERSGDGYVFPWYALGPYSIDLPTRFGGKAIDRLDAGQSTAMVEYRGAAAGISNENQWIGPGIRNALILSNNAPGFPHAFIRTTHPWETLIGAIEARLLVGGLTESHWFDTTSTNNLRSLSAVAVTVRPAFERNLVLGASRSVYATSKGWDRIATRFLDVFANTGRPNNRALGDSTLRPGGRDQIFSLFGRWVFPDDGFEAYAEWARLEFPYSLRDLLVAPNHSQGYTLGFQYARPAFRQEGRVRLQAELTSVEQSATFRDRPQGSFYTSRKVIQGYTQMGQSLAASIGPGASGQWLAFDYIEPSASVGIFAGRIRWNEDIHSTYGFPLFQGYCIHDVSVFPGARGSLNSRFGYISADIMFGNRLNAYFQEQSGCPKGNSVLDIRNRTLSITVGTFTPGRSR